MHGGRPGLVEGSEEFPCRCQDFQGGVSGLTSDLHVSKVLIYI